MILKPSDKEKLI